MGGAGGGVNMIKVHCITTSQSIHRNYFLKGLGKKKAGVRVVNKESVWLMIH